MGISFCKPRKTVSVVETGDKCIGAIDEAIRKLKYRRDSLPPYWLSAIGEINSAIDKLNSAKIEIRDRTRHYK